MFSSLTRLLSLACFLAGLAGCTCCAVREQTDRAICDLAAQTIDLEPVPAVEIPVPQPLKDESSASPPAQTPEIQPVAVQQPATDQKKKEGKGYRLEVPPG